jgi:hypothetical protein
VEVDAPEIAGPLLALDGRRGQGLQLHRDVAVHPFVRAVVRRRAPARAKALDAEAQPPGRQTGQAVAARGRDQRESLSVKTRAVTPCGWKSRSNTRFAITPVERPLPRT